MGESAARNAVYTALQKVPQGEAKKMAATLLDLKHTKGFDHIITPEIENWANKMIKQTSRVEMIKNIMSMGGLGAAGFALGGPALGAAAALTPKVYKGVKGMLKKHAK
jgi:hypothetical protein